MCSVTELCPLPNQLRCFENMASFFIVCVFVCIHVCMCVSAHVHVRALRTVRGGVRSQPRLSFVKSHPPSFVRQGLSLG